MPRPYKGAWAESAKRRERIVELYAMGWPAERIGKDVFLSTSTVFYHLRIAGQKRRGTNMAGKLSRTPLGSVERTIELYREGLTTRQVAERLGISHSTVRYRLLNAGIKLRPPVRTRR